MPRSTAPFTRLRATPRARPRALVAGLLTLGLLGGLATVSKTEPATAESAQTAQAISWVQRAGDHLTLDGQPWRFSGVNMYWLGRDDNLQDAGGATYPTHAAVDNGFAAAAALGATVVRATTLGVSVGSPRSLEPTLNHFDDQAFASIDYAVASARQHGERLMIPLTDEWHYYHGGKHTFTDWAGFHDLPGQNVVSSNQQRALEANFYTDPTVIGYFHTYIRHLLDHVNPLTGLRLGDDPTIAIWETGNEMWDAPPRWTGRTATFIKTLAPDALVADGSAASGKLINQTAYRQRDVDIIDGHFYPTDLRKARHDAAFTTAHGKVYVIGEYPLTGAFPWRWLHGISTDADVSGALAWTLLPWLPDGSPESHGDGYTFHLPGADPAERRVDVLLGHAATWTQG